VLAPPHFRPCTRQHVGVSRALRAASVGPSNHQTLFSTAPLELPWWPLHYPAASAANDVSG